MVRGGADPPFASKIGSLPQTQRTSDTTSCVHFVGVEDIASSCNGRANGREGGATEPGPGRPFGRQTSVREAYLTFLLHEWSSAAASVACLALCLRVPRSAVTCYLRVRVKEVRKDMVFELEGVEASDSPTTI